MIALERRRQRLLRSTLDVDSAVAEYGRNLTLAELMVMRLLAVHGALDVSELVRRSRRELIGGTAYRAVGTLLERSLVTPAEQRMASRESRRYDLTEEGVLLLLDREQVRGGSDARLGADAQGRCGSHASGRLTTLYRKVSAGEAICVRGRGRARLSPLELVCLEVLAEEAEPRDARWVVRKARGWVHLATARSTLGRMARKGYLHAWEERTPRAQGVGRRPRYFTLSARGRSMMRRIFVVSGGNV